jgi:hypothetical protein
MAEKEYISPGVFGIPIATKPKTYSDSANYMLMVVLHPSNYKWRILGIDKTWRDSYEGKYLERNYYSIQYSNDHGVSIQGTIDYYLGSGVIIDVVCEDLVI